MTDNTNKVTIDVAWFDELRSAAGGEVYKTLEAAYDQVRKERDDLRARLASAEDYGYCRGLQAAKNRLAAAERCIEDVGAALSRTVTIGNIIEAQDAIRAYRESKEAK